MWVLQVCLRDHIFTMKYMLMEKVNSKKLKLPSGKILKGEERKQFELERIKIDLKLSELR